jgi:hypothetical protein
LIKRRFGDPWYISMGLFYLSEQKPVEGEAADDEYNSVFMRKEAALAELRLWYSSFYSMIKKGTVPETVGSLMLRMHFKSCGHDIRNDPAHQIHRHPRNVGYS